VEGGRAGGRSKWRKRQMGQDETDALIMSSKTANNVMPKGRMDIVLVPTSMIFLKVYVLLVYY
jgi:hypothetical protein